MNNNIKRIVFFDGVCGLCNLFLDHLMRWDTGHKFLFASLQGKTAGDTLPSALKQGFGTIVYSRNGKLYSRSGAVLRIFTDLGGWRHVAVILFIIPPFIRNAVYDFIAKHRYDWFGKKESCRIPTPDERKFFLD